MKIIIIKILRIQNLISRLKDIYIKESRGKKTKAYDSYSHFFRWATDRLGKQGIICFITNSLFLDGSFFDRFRKVISKKFFHAYFLDQGDDIRAISGIDGIFIREKNTIFGKFYMTGIVVSFLLKDGQEKTVGNLIYYSHLFPMHELRENKFQFLAATKFSKIDFENIQADKNNNWINLTDNDFNNLLPIADKNTRLAKSKTGEIAIFKVFILGIATNRYEWLYDFDRQQLAEKIQFFCKFYEHKKARWNQSNNKTVINDFFDRKIKYTSEL